MNSQRGSQTERSDFAVANRSSCKAQCYICPHACTLNEGQVGICRTRRNKHGAVVSDSYGRITSLALDPIEKKPLARFMPGSMILSAGSFGCNLRCPFCQNASIAHAGIDDVLWQEITPEQLVEQATRLKVRGNVGIAYTYNEPLVTFEFVRDCAKLAHDAGLVNVLVSNGMANAKIITELAPLLDAVNIDLKGFTQDFYDFVGGSLDTVKQTIKLLVEYPTCHVEVTTLVIPGKNDTDEEIGALSGWLPSLDYEIPCHVSRFFPCYKMSDAKPTPVRTVYHLAEVARKHLRYVYTGNC
jgi:pyruvate formate lyase activating enzyme